MKTFVTALALAVGTEALVARTDSCCFHLTATGGPGGSVGQLSDGQNRIGQGLPTAQYCIKDGGLTDGNGRGCILTPPTTQFQCDAGATPQGGFAVGCDGTLTWSGNSKFVACPTGDNGGFNIYTTAPAGQGGCVDIKLTSDGCKSGCPPPPPPPPQTCPTNLNGNFEFPHLIVPISKSNCDTAYGTSYFGKVTSDVSSIFNFDIPPSDAGKKCSLVFLFPEQKDLETSSFTFSGSGAIDFSSLTAPATEATTFNNAPGVAKDFGVTTVAPGNSYVIATFDCPAGQRIGFEMKSADDSTSLDYFQDYNPSPIGLYITVC